jgi:hypothetical protein
MNRGANDLRKPEVDRLDARRYSLIVAAIAASVLIPSFAAIFWLAAQFGSASTPAQLAELQSVRPDAVILPFDLRYNGAFKLRRIELEGPEIICFSSSRAGLLNAGMFAPYRFQNMSFTAWTTEQLLDVFERATRTSRPRVAIISLDYFMFSDRWEATNGGSRDMIFDQPYRYVRTSVGNFIRTAATHPDTFEDYWRTPNAFIGTQSIISHEGFRADGSYTYSEGRVQYARAHFRTVRFLTDSLPGAPTLSARQREPLIRLAKMAQRRGIILVAVQLPFIGAAVDYLDHNESYRPLSGVWQEFESSEMRAWIRSLGIVFFDLAHSPITNDTDNFIDSYHPSEIGTLRVMQTLLQSADFQSVFPAINRASIDQSIADLERTHDKGHP